MPAEICLASASTIRKSLLENAGLAVTVAPARIDEASIKQSLVSEAAGPRDIADALAEMKARKISQRHPDALVLGCDQVLALKRDIFSKPEDPDDLKRQLRTLRGQTHHLMSAAVLYQEGEPLWRHVGVVRMMMRDLSDAYIDDYVAEHWEDVRSCVGGYKLEGQGVRLFSRVEGDYFSVLGLPLLELLSYLTLRGTLPQ
jgi:septum formation protein